MFPRDHVVVQSDITKRKYNVKHDETWDCVSQ